MLIRRRPLPRETGPAGDAYLAGQSAVRRPAAHEQQQDEQNERLASPEELQAAQARAAASHPGTAG